jgi:hypothetical protein
MLGFLLCAVQVFARLRRYAASIGSWLLAVNCPTRNLTLRNAPEERRPQGFASTLKTTPDQNFVQLVPRLLYQRNSTNPLKCVMLSSQCLFSYHHSPHTLHIRLVFVKITVVGYVTPYIFVNIYYRCICLQETLGLNMFFFLRIRD